MIEIENVSMIFEKESLIFPKKEAQDSSALREKALDDVSLTIPDGCIYGFLGSNGAGKSTLMRLMCGIYKAASGSIRIDGEEVYDNPEAKKNIFFVNDETIEYTHFTLDSLMKYYRSYYPNEFDTEIFSRLAGELSLPLNQQLGAFSKGMKRQAVVIIGLACRTKYLVLDEAFDGLDPAMRTMIKSLIIDEIKKRNTALVISSHNIREIGELCDRAMLIHKGRLVFADEVGNIKGRFRKYQLVNLERTITPDEISAAGINAAKYSAEGKVAQIIVRGEEGTDEKIASLDTVLAEQIPLTLEEIFIYEMNTKGYGNDLINKN